MYAEKNYVIVPSLRSLNSVHSRFQSKGGNIWISIFRLADSLSCERMADTTASQTNRAMLNAFDIPAVESTSTAVPIDWQSFGGRRPFQCFICEKQYSSKARLRCHIESLHLEMKPFGCDVCAKKFYQKRSVREHLEIVHAGKRPFQCDACQKKFTQATSLRVHERIHTGEKPFQCEMCQKKFSRKDDLVKHLRRVHI